MNVDVNKILSVHEMANDMEGTRNKIAMNGELYVFEDNRLQFVLMAPEKYEEVMSFYNSSDVKSSSNDNSSNEDEDVETLLNSIGKKIFVDYYNYFKEDHNPEDKLPNDLSLNSRRSRTSSARRLFRNCLNLEALEIIADSKRLDEETVNKARFILRKECGSETETNEDQLQNKQWYDIDKRYSMKIGRLVKNMMPILFKNESISECEIKKMLTDSYSKNTFNLNFPVLKEVPPEGNITDLKRDSNGYNRYYDFTLYIYEKRYLLCSQWSEQLHRKYFEGWLDRIERELENE